MGFIPVNIADHVGRTPMVQLTRLAPEGGAEIFGKLEWFNPGGSIKDRIGVAMIEAAEAEGRIEPGRTTIVEATSGNTGIALAFVCAAKGYDLVLTLPQGMSRERERLLQLYGARVEITESLGGMNEAVDAARAMASDPDIFLPDQFSNPAPMPWILCGPGGIPESTAEVAGSTATTCVLGLRSFSTSPTPVIVPPVPTPATR